MSCLFKADSDIHTSINDYVVELSNSVSGKLGADDFPDDLSVSKVDEIIENINASYVNYVTHLRSLPLEHHKTVWITVLSTIACKSSNLSKSIIEYGEKHPDKAVTSITLKLCQTFLLQEETQLRFLKQLNEMVPELIDMFNNSSKLFDLFVSFINSVLSTTQNSLPVDNGLLDNSSSTLRKITILVKKLYISSKGRKTVLSSLFTSIVNLLECIYECDQSHLVLELIDDILYPELPMKLSKESKIGLDYILDHYIYTAFNLFSLSYSDSKVDGEMTKKADLYFKIFLTLPPSSYDLYVSFRKIVKEEIVYQVVLPENTSDRRKAFKRIEVSILYLFNKVFMARDLDDIVSFSPMVSSELENCHGILSGILTSSLNDEIKRASSASLSSVVDQEPIEPLIPRLNLRSVGSMVHNGTYKERFYAVIKVIEQFIDLDINKFGKCFSLDLDYNSDFIRLFNSIEKSSGRTKYFKLVSLVSKYLKLLSLKFLVKSVGSNEFSLTKLKEFLDTPSSVLEILDIKPLLKYEVSSKNNEEIYRFSVNELSLGTQQDVINHQLELAKHINGLETTLEGNVYEMTKR